MKPLKSLAGLCLCLLLALTLTACATRTPVTEDAFTAVMEELNFSSQEVDEDVMKQSGGEGVEKLLMYFSATGGGSAYYLYSDPSYAQKQYATLLNSMQQQQYTKEKQVDSATYNFARYSSGESSFVMIRTDNTLLFISDTKYMVDEVLKGLGY